MRIALAEFSTLTERHGAWKPEDFRALLSELDLETTDEINPVDLRELTLMALHDLEPARAAKMLLRLRLDSSVADGQIQHFSEECQHERLWEQSADMEMHRDLFDVASLLSAANSTVFPKADAVGLLLFVDCQHGCAGQFQSALHEPAALTRLIAAGMTDDAILHRLFSDQIAGTDFPEAASIIWERDICDAGESQLTVSVCGSSHWLADLQNAQPWSWIPAVAT